MAAAATSVPRPLRGSRLPTHRTNGVSTRLWRCQRRPDIFGVGFLVGMVNAVWDDAQAFGREPGVSQQLVGRRPGAGEDDVGSPGRGSHTGMVEPAAPQREGLGEEPGRGVVDAHHKAFARLRGDGQRRRVDNLHLPVTAQRRPVEHVPGVVQSRPGQRQHRRFGYRAEPELCPGRLDFLWRMPGHHRPHVDAKGSEVGHQLGRVATDAARRRQHQLFYVDGDAQDIPL